MTGIYNTIKLGLGLALCALAPAYAEGKITLFYNERPPYLMTQPDGSVTGLTADAAASALKKAGIAFMWQKVPANRQLFMIQSNGGEECAVGWFRNAEREKYAKFSKSIYQDKPTVALIRNDIDANAERLDTWLIAQSIRILAKENYSYGTYLDELLARWQQTVIYTAAENSKMLHMLEQGRADMMFMAEEEYNFIGRHGGMLRMVRFADLPQGEKRYLLCSKKVPDELLERFNQQLPKH